MRQIESVIGVAALVVVSMVMERSVIWRRNAAAVTAAVVTFLVVFVIPWVVWSTRIFGSVAGRLDTLSAQMSGNADMHWGNGLTKYVEALSGTLRTYGIFDEVPRWPRWIMLVSLVLVGSTLAVAVLDRRTTRRQRWTIFACAAPAVALFIFFVFLYSSVEVRERYMANLMPFAAALVGMGVAWAWDRRGTIRSPSVRATLISGFAVLVCMWAIAQVAIAIPFQQARVLDAETTLVTSNTIRAFVEDQPCVGASRYSRVQIQLGTGCAVGGVTSEESAILRASEFEIGRVGAFIVWPTRLDLGEEWTVIDRSSEAGSAFLHLLQREGD